jgi:PAS domain-containing protein
MADETVRGAIAGRLPFRFHHRVLRSEGEVRLILGLGRVQTDAGGRVVKLVGTAQDVTEQQQALDALECSERRYRLLAESSSDIVATLLPEGTLTFLTPSVRWELGWEVKELVGRNVSELLHPDEQ